MNINSASASSRFDEYPSSTTTRTREPRLRILPPSDRKTSFTRYINEVCRTKLLTPREEIQLAIRMKRGDKTAREQMINANLRLVVKIAKDYEDFGVPLLDLVSEGNIGLMKAVDRFDPAKGAKFSTYGGWWIKQSIKRALAHQSRTIRLPVHVVDKLFRMRRVSVQLHDVLGRAPTDEELAGEVGISPRKIARLRTASLRPSSLQSPVNHGEPTPIADLVEDENAGTPYENLEKKTNAEMIHKLLGHLSPRESEILRHRFGLDGDQAKTLEEIGPIFGLTRERIRQIQNVVLLKLRKEVEKIEMLQVAA